MKSIYAGAALLATITGANWVEYPVYLPPNITTVGEISTNNGGHGNAITGGPYEAVGPTLGLVNGAWAYYAAPPKTMAFISTAAEDDTLYALNNSYPTSELWRFRPPAAWEIAAYASNYGFTGFSGVAGVAANTWWTVCDGTDEDGVVYFEAGKPAKIWKIRGQPNNARYIVVPRTANPSGEAYVQMRAWSEEYSEWHDALFVIKPGGTYSVYWIPLVGYHCTGLAAYQPGEVRLIMASNSYGGPSTLMKWSNGVFTKLQTFPERVWLRCYPSPSEGWGTTFSSKIYHWTDAGFSESYTLPGTVDDLDFVSVNDGWAVGSYGEWPNNVPKMWHYTSSGASVVPSSLGRVKAAFK